MTYEAPKLAKNIGRVIVGALFLALLVLTGLIFGPPITEHYAKKHAYSVMEFCSKENGMKIDWRASEEFVTLDIEVRYFYATNDAERSAIDCIRKRAPDYFHVPTLTAICEQASATVAIERVIRGQNYSPPTEIISFRHIECVNTDVRSTETDPKQSTDTPTPRAAPT